VFGQPSSWSAVLDALAAGLAVTTADDGLVFLSEAEDAAHRLFLVSAGNVRAWDDDHLARSDVEPVEDPAQAWNVLTVGAFTERDTMANAPPGFEGWTPLAPRGELSPFSRTSVACSRRWPAKPDVVLEGGNVARSPGGTDYDTPENLQLLTTNAPLRSSRLLTTAHATSAATAQAAALAASVMAEYPALWPETVRALIAHSAEWTPAMRARFATDRSKTHRIALQRRYGMGVPDLLRATRSATDALTLVAQYVIHPFNGRTMGEIHFHALPWPTDILMELGEAQVRLRVTLSYFIEPNPASCGWRSRYSYASHGLRCDIRRATESDAAFQKRINQKALGEGERRPASADDTGEWFFGSNHQRAPGSLHSDIWTGNAADLAQRGTLAVFPVTGWWKEIPARRHGTSGARYSLVVSIETPQQDVDIWTPVAAQIGTESAITIPN
ncbi:MAG: S8 family serine peptidase, partial [Pseudonocardiaceae bacterium]